MSLGFRSAEGLDFATDSIVDAHFAACADAYRRIVRGVGLRPGWRVLDAGCGGGSFLPLLAELVGDHRRVTGIDLGHEHVALAARRTGIAVAQGDVTRLPYADASFDAAWCANTTQYLDDGQLRAALAELRRVVRAGGLVAVKDLDAGLIAARPGDPHLVPDFFRQAAASTGYARQLLRGPDLYRWLAGAGLADVRQETVLIEHHAPFSPAVKRFYGASCAQLARQAEELGAPGRWAPFRSPDDPANPLNDPDAYICEGNVVAVGIVAT